MKNKPYPYYNVGDYCTLSEFMTYIREKNSTKIAVKYIKNKQKIEKTYDEMVDEIEALARKINSLDLIDKNIAVLGENSYEWVLSYMAITVSKNTVVPIDKDLEISEVLNLLKEADVDLIFYSNTYSDYGDTIKKEINGIKVVSFDEMDNYIEDGKKLDRELPKVTPQKNATIIFTSGTTGKPKGVLLSHQNLCEDIKRSSMQLLITGDSLLVLPLHHTFPLMANVLCMFNIGYAISIPNSLKKVDKLLQESKPATMFLVPLLVEAFYNKIWKNIKQTKKTVLVKTMICISNMLLALGIDVRRKVFKSVIDAFGGNLNLIVSGGAALDPKYVKGFRNFGIEVLNGYGITECSPIVSVNRNKYNRDGSVGTALSGIDIKIEQYENSREGEILVKGPIVMQGYYKNSELTKEVMSEDYFRTGDIGYLDDDGFLYITGRKKNVIILDNGKNVYPEELEEILLHNSLIKEVLVYEKDGKIVATIYPDFEEISDLEKVKSTLEKIIEEFNKKMPYYKKISQFFIRENEFEKTTTKKIKRSIENVR